MRGSGDAAVLGSSNSQLHFPSSNTLLMSSCNASYTFLPLPINPASVCGATCNNVTFGLTSMNTSTGPGGGCEFTWTVTRTTKDEEGNVLSTTDFADDAVLGCPGVKKIQFHCDATKNCPAYELTIMCMKNPEETGGTGV